MSGVHYSKEAVIRAANMYILRKVVDTMLKENEKYYQEIFGVGKSTLNEIVAGTTSAGKNWEYKIIAQKMHMDEDVFSGKRLIYINGETISYIKDNFEKLVADININVTEKGFSEKKKKLLKEKDKVTSEYALWDCILNEREYKSGDIWNKAKTHILREVAKQTKEENFEDAQLWKFWNYIKKNYSEKKLG